MDFFFSPERPLSLVINIAIAVMGLIALVQIGFMEFGRILQEQLELDKARNFFREIKPAKETEEFVTSLRLDTIIRDRITNLWKLKQAGDDVNHDALSAIAKSKLEETAAFGRWAASSVVLLGLAGTLTGLASSVRSADNILRNLGTTQLEAVNAVLQTFSGIQVAFSTTLMGVFWAAVLSLFIVLMRGRQSKYLLQLEEFSLVTLIPSYKSSAGVALAESVQKLTELEFRLDGALREVIDQLHTRGMALTSTVEKSFNELTNRFHNKSEELLNNFSEIQITLDALLGTKGEDVKPLAENLKMLQVAVTGVQQVSKEVNQMLPRLEESIARQIDLQTKDLNETMRGHRALLGDMADRQGKLLDHGVEKIADAIINFDKSIPKLKESIASQVDQQTKDLNETLKTYKTIIENAADKQSVVLDRGIKDISEAISNYIESIPQLKEAIASQVDQQTKDLNDTLNVYSSLQNRKADKQIELFETGITKISGVVEELNKAILPVNEVFGANLQSYVDAVKELSGNFSVLNSIREKLGRLDDIERHLKNIEQIQNTDGNGREHLQITLEFKEYVSRISAEVTEIKNSMGSAITEMSSLSSSMKQWEKKKKHPHNSSPFGDGRDPGKEGISGPSTMVNSSSETNSNSEAGDTAKRKSFWNTLFGNR